MIKEQKGQSLTEFALLVPLLLLLTCGIFDFGRMLYGYLHMNLASQESVRLAGLGKGDTQVFDFARNYVHLGDPQLLEVLISPSETYRQSGDYVKVELQYPMSYLTPLISNILPPLVIKTDSTIRVE